MKQTSEKREVVFEKADAYKSLELINGWIGNMDAKASFLLAYLAVVMGFVVSNGVPRINSEQSVNTLGITQWIKIVLVISLYIALILSITLLLGTLTAHIKGSKRKHSLLFFGEIASLTLNEYKSKILNRTEEELIKDLLDQVHTNAVICTKKSKLYNACIRVTFVATILYAVCIGLRLL